MAKTVIPTKETAWNWRWTAVLHVEVAVNLLISSALKTQADKRFFAGRRHGDRAVPKP